MKLITLESRTIAEQVPRDDQACIVNTTGVCRYDASRQEWVAGWARFDTSPTDTWIPFPLEEVGSDE